jgi:predicted enzyme related to lactoylglutathione lyase
MPPSIGQFVWYELATNDAPAATAFYRRVFGWDAKDAGMEGQPYTLLSAGPNMVAGLFSMAGQGCDGPPKPSWMGYIGVEDVDAHAALVQEGGGSILRPPADIPGVGRFAVAADPYGAVFMLFKGTSDPGPAPVQPGTPGHIGWHELHAGNGEGAFAFYSKLFGWTKAEAMDMGRLGLYQIFAVGGIPVGGMMTKMPEAPVSFWLYYVTVEGIDAALKRNEEGGGKLLMGPEQVPGGSWIAQCLDPEGAIFAMVAPVRA